VILRDAAPADLRALIDLWQEAWQVTMPEIDFAARRPGFTGKLADMLAEGVRLRMAETDEAMAAGFYTLDAGGYLDQVAVKRSLWGRGVASRLIEDAKHLSGGRLSLTVNQANHRAIAFYEREGFQRGEASVNPVSGLPLWVYRWDSGQTSGSRP